MPAIAFSIGIMVYKGYFLRTEHNILVAIFYGYYFLILLPVIHGIIRPHSLLAGLKQGLEQAVVEIETVRKILIVITPILAIVAALVIILFLMPILVRPLVTPDELFQRTRVGFVYIVLVEITSIEAGVFSLYFALFIKKESRFYFSKASFRIARSKKDLNQMHYFALGLQEYNRYLKRNLKLQISDTNKIFSKVSLLNMDKRAEIVNLLSDGFETEADRLKPLRTISTELVESENAESVLIPESLKSKLRAIGAFLGASIPIIISIITLVRR